MPSIEDARRWYPPSDPVHGFDHVLRVYALAERLALAEGADLEIVRAAVLLHDAQENPGNQSLEARARQVDPEARRANHQLDSAEIAARALRAEGWDKQRIAQVQHCIRAHRFRSGSEPPRSLEARVLFDADKLDAIGAVGVARAIAYATQHGNPIYARPSEQFLGSGQQQAGEPHSAYHEYLFKLRNLKDRLHTQTARQMAEARHHRMETFFEQLAAEMDENPD